MITVFVIHNLKILSDSAANEKGSNNHLYALIQAALLSNKFTQLPAKMGGHFASTKYA